MGQLQAGAARIDITPHLGCEMAGYAGRTEGSRSIADPLYAKAIVLTDDQQKIALVTTDLIGVKSDLVEQVRSKVASGTDLSADNIMISCSHTHFGPATYNSETNLTYIDHLALKLETVIRLANQNLQPARIGVGEGIIDTISYNRHTILPDGKAETNFRLPPKTADVTFGPCDPVIKVLRIDNLEQERIATLINFACHPVTSTDQMHTISADYPGYAMQVVEQIEGGLCLFGLGCAGNIVPIQREGSYSKMIGRSLGSEAVKVAQWIQTVDQGELNVVHDTVTLPLKDTESSEDIPIHCMSINQICFVGLPGEIFVEIGLAIRQRVKSDEVGKVNDLLLMSLTNGSVGYIPVYVAFEQGGYESGVSRFRPGCGEKLTEQVVSLIERLNS